jgi:hypothetical protein
MDYYSLESGCLNDSVDFAADSVELVDLNLGVLVLHLTVDFAEVADTVEAMPDSVATRLLGSLDSAEQG